MPEALRTPVLIVGAGAVGLTLAIDLAWRGVRVVLMEQRSRGVAPPVKCNHVSARSMEVFRRLGIAQRIRDAGLPADYPHSVSYRTTMTGIELTRVEIPSRKDRFTCTDGPDCGWPTPEPPHRINQIYLEPILFAHAESLPQITVLSGVRYDRLEQTAEGVTAWATDTRKGTTLRIECRYLVACDGSHSQIRREIGAELSGDAILQRTQTTYIRAPELLGRLRSKPAWGNFSLNPRRCGNVYAIDGRQTWLVHNYLTRDEKDFDSVDRDACLRAILGVGPEFRYDVLDDYNWYGRRLVCDRFRNGRVFLCGDASHIWVPYAGYGMNAGIADAVDLSWMLAAHLTGWAPAAILDAYEAERLPITEQVSRFVMNHSIAMSKERLSVPDNIEAMDAAGEAARAALGKQAYALNVQQYAAAGLNFGYFYDRSPLIGYDGATPPPYTMATFTASTV
ncbi:MAG TPA: FAD-dependent monooxygenase, partial [Nevskiaceae bacterium]